MREIMELAKRIRKEMDRADMYAYEANKHKEQYPELAQHYYKAANEHIAIADDLHSAVVQLIDKTKRSGVEPPAGMLKAWEFEHEMMIEDKNEILHKLAMYKG